MQNSLEPFLYNVKNALEINDVERIEEIQSLWSGYGGLYRLFLNEFSKPSVIVKLISLVSQSEHPRGWSTNIGHQRKVKSYEVEQSFYESFASSLNEGTKVAQLLFTDVVENQKILVLEDLSTSYPVLKQNCTFKEASVVIKWLARFHATFLNKTPNKLWPIGSYWHLTTRQEELAVMKDSPLKANAQKLDQILNEARFRTIIHGDAKVANFCFSEDDQSTAAVDFQYVGGGVGVKDVAYFIGSCFTSDECALYEDELLRIYYQELLNHTELSNDEKVMLEKEWRGLYPIAWADFNRFLLGWMPSHKKLHQHALHKNEEALSAL